MSRMKAKIKTVVTASMIMLAGSSSVLAELKSKNELDTLYEALTQAEAKTAAGIESDIVRLWELSGSVSVDFLYKNGDDAFFQIFDFGSVMQHGQQRTVH